MSVSKFTSDRNQKVLLDLAAKPGNDVCADCKARTPRWASHNLGIFICVNCASIHRKIGTHITKVKSLTLDSWTKEQVERMKEMGNLNSNAIYNPNELRHPPPPMLTEDERDSELEKYIRAKYEYKKFFDRHALVASKLGPSRSSSSISPRPRTSPNEKTSPPSPVSPASARPSTTAISSPPPVTSNLASQSRSFTIPTPSASSLPLTQQQPISQQSLTPSASNPTNGTANGVWQDLVMLQAPSANSSLPLQYQPPTSAPLGSANPFSHMGALSSAGMPTSATGVGGYGSAGIGMSTGPNGLTINPTGMTMGVGLNSPFSSGLGSGMGIAPNPFQQTQFPSTNPFAQQQPLSAAYPSPSMTFSAVPAGLSTPFSAQASPLYQSQPQQQQSPHPMFSPSPQMPMQNQQFMPQGHSPQPQMQMSTTPQPQGQFMSSPSPHLQSGMGMGMGMGMSNQQQPQMFSAGGQQWGQQQQPMFATAGQGQQWGGM